MDEEHWLSCTDPVPMLDFVRGKASDRKLRLFACGAWRWRYTRSGPRPLRWTLFRALLAPLEKAERAADGRGRAFVPGWWGSFTFSGPDAFHAALGTALTFRKGFLGLTDPPAEAAALCRLLRDIIGSPFRRLAPVDPAWLAWHGGAIVKLAQAVYEERALPSGHLDAARLAVLADMLEEAGSTDAALLSHVRSAGPHVRGCHALDSILGRG
jgi:hypothetical protein